MRWERGRERARSSGEASAFLGAAALANRIRAAPGVRQALLAEAGKIYEARPGLPECTADVLAPRDGARPMPPVRSKRQRGARLASAHYQGVIGKVAALDAAFATLCRDAVRHAFGHGYNRTWRRACSEERFDRIIAFRARRRSIGRGPQIPAATGSARALSSSLSGRSRNTGREDRVAHECGRCPPSVSARNSTPRLVPRRALRRTSVLEFRAVRRRGLPSQSRVALRHRHRGVRKGLRRPRRSARRVRAAIALIGTLSEDGAADRGSAEALKRSSRGRAEQARSSSRRGFRTRRLVLTRPWSTAR